jgi:gluconate 2-dehydrogenase gamma chain
MSEFKVLGQEDAGLSRRNLLKSAAMAATLGGMTLEAAQHVHHAAAEEKKVTGAAYKPKAFNAHEWKTLQRLSDLIIPADNVSKGALDAGAPEFIDLLSSQSWEMRAIYTGGLAWIDRESEDRHGASFVNAKPEQQTALLDLIAYKKNIEKDPQIAPGVRFFAWMRRMVADAFWTSPIGVKDLDFRGNKGATVFQVPKEALEYALSRSPK